jgi:hypothetical protein
MQLFDFFKKMKTMELWNLKFSHNCTQLEIRPTVSQEKIVRLWRSEKKNAGYDRVNLSAWYPSLPTLVWLDAIPVSYISPQLSFLILLLGRQLEVLALRRMNRNLVQNKYQLRINNKLQLVSNSRCFHFPGLFSMECTDGESRPFLLSKSPEEIRRVHRSWSTCADHAWIMLHVWGQEERFRRHLQRAHINDPFFLDTSLT